MLVLVLEAVGTYSPPPPPPSKKKKKETIEVVGNGCTMTPSEILELY